MTHMTPQARIEGLRNLRTGYESVTSAVGFWESLHGEDIIEEYAGLFEQFQTAHDALVKIAEGPSDTSPPEIARCALGWPSHGWDSHRMFWHTAEERERVLAEDLEAARKTLRAEQARFSNSTAVHLQTIHELKDEQVNASRQLDRLKEQFEAAQEAIRRIADDVHLVLNDHYSGRTEERIPALPAYARLTVIVEEDEDRIRDVPGVIAAALDPVAAGYYPGAFIEAVNASSPASRSS